MSRLRLFESPNPRERRIPIRIKRHGRFKPALTITILGFHWSNTLAILPTGTRLDGGGHPDWLGGMSWNTRYSGRPWSASRKTTRPLLARCRWRYR